MWEAPDTAFESCEEPPPGSGRWYGSETGTKLHYREWATWGSPEDIVLMARDGARWIAEEGVAPGPAAYDNYSATTEPQWRDIIQQQFDGFHADGIIEYLEDWQKRFPGGTEEDFVLVVNPVGIVPKADDPSEGRPIFDCSRSGVNDAMLPLPFSLPRPTDFLAHLRAEARVCRTQEGH